MAKKRTTAPAPDRLSKTRDTCERYGWGRTALWEKLRRDPSFPAPVYLGDRSPRWNWRLIDEYIAVKTAERRQSSMRVVPNKGDRQVSKGAAK